MSLSLPLPSARLLIDLRLAIDAPFWGARNNPDAEKNVADLLAVWRKASWPVIHVRHDSREETSTYRPGITTHGFKPQAMPIAGEMIIPNQAHSAFVGTDLDRRLRERGIGSLVVAGVITDNSVKATVRHGADLGWSIALVEDACFTVDRALRDGRTIAAADMHERALALLEVEYAQIVSTAHTLAWVESGASNAP